MAKTETKNLERTYNIPLRKEYQKVARWKRTKKAAKAVREFLQKHMKSEDVRLGKNLNEKLWKHGIRNPPHHIKVTVQKDSEGVVKAELFGYKIEEKKVEVKKKSKLAEMAEKAGVKVQAKPTEKKEEKKTEERPEVEKEEKKEEKPKEEKKVEKETPAKKE